MREKKISTDENHLLEELLKRHLLVKTEEKTISVKLTDTAQKLLSGEISFPSHKDKEKISEFINEFLSEQAETYIEINKLDKEFIKSGKWNEVRIRPYDIAAPVEKAMPGKLHPLRVLINRISDIFSEMGFEEMNAGFVESSFWNFDALFQPQDHPARELADTFYLREPEKIPLPNKKIVDEVKRAHEDGWKYKWSEKIAEQPVLRTHTTAVSARYLANIREGKRKSPSKFFCVGRVFRNEATDFKHLAEFYQVEGIVVWEKATFANLLGCLEEFYRKLGFEKIKFRPSYFPYTEPSVEVLVYFEEKKQWLELGGAGVFRPEVCLPLWGKYPVLAWGLSLERPAMMLMGLDDIRTFYKNNLSWLRSAQVSKWR